MNFPLMKIRIFFQFISTSLTTIPLTLVHAVARMSTSREHQPSAADFKAIGKWQVNMKDRARGSKRHCQWKTKIVSCKKKKITSSNSSTTMDVQKLVGQQIANGTTSLHINSFIFYLTWEFKTDDFLYFSHQSK